MTKNSKACLHADLFKDEEGMEKSGTRDGFGKGLLEAGKKNKHIVALSADLAESTRVHLFAEEFPERFIEIGVAEQNLVTVASGLAAEGKIPFASSFSAFSPGRNWEQIRTTVCYNDQPVKVVGTHAGLSVGADGATHQALEDLATTRVIPNMVVLSPCDAEEARKATLAAAEYDGPVYLRLHREKFPTFTTTKTPFTIGKAEVFTRGKDVTVVATGPSVYQALLAAKELKGDISVEVINAHTVKPIDTQTIVRSAKKTGAVVTVEDHQVSGGLGGAVAEALAIKAPTPMEFVGVHDSYGESGKTMELWKKHGMDVDGIISSIRSVLKKKK